MILLTARTPESCAVARDLAEENGVQVLVHQEMGTDNAGGVGAWVNGKGNGFHNANTSDHAINSVVPSFRRGGGWGVGNGSGCGDGFGFGVGYGATSGRLPM